MMVTCYLYSCRSPISQVFTYMAAALAAPPPPAAAAGGGGGGGGDPSFLERRGADGSTALVSVAAGDEQVCKAARTTRAT